MPALNFGLSKGQNFDRVLIFPNGPISVGSTQRIGTTISRDAEIIWGLDSLVIFKITSDAASNKVSWIIPWYEHIDLE